MDLTPPTIVDLIAQAHQHGVALELVADRVRYRPSDAMPPELLEALRERRPELLEALQERARAWARIPIVSERAIARSGSIVVLEIQHLDPPALKRWERYAIAGDFVQLLTDQTASQVVARGWIAALGAAARADAERERWADA